MEDISNTKPGHQEPENSPNLPRKERRKSQQHIFELSQLVATFYRDVSRKQLKDEELKDVFSKYNAMWVRYCAKKKLSDESKSLFALQIQSIWQKRLEKANQ